MGADRDLGHNLVITAGAAFALYKPFGVGGIVAATAIATAASVAAQAVVLRRLLGGLEITKLILDDADRVASAALAGGPTPSGTSSTTPSAPGSWGRSSR